MRLKQKEEGIRGWQEPSSMCAHRGARINCWKECDDSRDWYRYHRS